jgi:biotin carboxyl carrier protein
MSNYKLIINGNPYEVKIKSITDEKADVIVNGIEYTVNIEKETRELDLATIKPKPAISAAFEQTKKTESPSKSHSLNVIKAPIPGIITKILQKENAVVKAGTCILMMEAMKMENEIQTPINGKVKKIHVREGQNVLESDPLFEIGGE